MQTQVHAQVVGCEHTSMISPVHESLRQSAADSLYIVGQFVAVIVRQPALPDDRSTSEITLLFDRCHKPLSSMHVLHVLLATLRSPQLFKYGLAGGGRG